MRKKFNFRNFDRTLFLLPILIFLIGLASIYSASFRVGQPLDQSLAVRQILWMGIGVLLVFLTVRVDYFRLQDWAWPLYFASLFFLVVVLFMPSRLGAHRWIQVGGFNFQPSEFAKLTCIFVLSSFFSNNRIENISRAKMCVPFIVVGVPFLLILKEPDLGTGLLLIPILFSMLYLWGFKKRYLFALFLVALVSTPILFHFLKDYQKSRLLVFINPNADPLGTGYTIIQSKIAIGSGGLFGKGFMGGTQNQLNFIPERHTDFIFPVIAEEGGLFVSLIVMVLFGWMIKKGFKIASQTPDRFGSELACGISVFLACQIIMNLGMTMGLLPVVGVPLPLVSYGGTSVVITMLSVGLLLNIKMHRPIF